jgi:D-methionine transport system permease protein
MSFREYAFDFVDRFGGAILESCGQTFIMVGASLIWSFAIGFPLAVLLVLTRKGRRLENAAASGALNAAINTFRSLPFIILLFFILPVTKFIAGTTIGIKGAIVPLVFYCAPYLARLIENSLLEVDEGVLEAYDAMGLSTAKIVLRVWIPEALPSLVLSVTTATIGLVGATAMAGIVGGGGLGDLAYRYGFQRFQPDVMVVTVVILIVLVQGVQSLGNALARHYRRDAAQGA